MSTDEFELEDFLPYLLNQAAEALSQEFQKTYKARYGMLRTEWRVLFHIGLYAPMTAKQICDRASLHKTKVSRAVAALEQKRYVVRQAIEEDRRHAALRLTKLGAQVFRDLYSQAQVFNTRVYSGMSENDAQVLNRCLAQIAGLDRPLARPGRSKE